MKGITKEQEERLLLYATYTILYLNDTACFSIQQLNKDVNEKDKESKKIYGALLKRNHKYLKLLSSIVDDRMDYYCDYCTMMDDICDDDYANFKEALKIAYEQAHIEDCEYIAKVETMRSMVEIAVEAGKRIIDDVYKYEPKVLWLRHYLLVEISRVANNFSDWSYRKVPKDINIDFNEDTDVMKKFRKLKESLIDYNSFDKAYRKAAELDQERKKETK